MWSRLKTACISLPLAAGLSSALSAGPVRPVTLAELVDAADVVVTGRVLQIRDLGPTTVTPLESGPRPGRAFEARIAVWEWLKGAPDGDTVAIGFALPDVSNGFRGLQTSGTFALFLKRRDQRYQFATPFFPAIPVASINTVAGASPADNLVRALGALLELPNAPSDDKVEAVEWLSTSDRPLSQEVLRAALVANDAEVQLRSAGALLRMNDVSGLPLIEAALLRRGGHELRPATRRDLIGALARGINAEAAVPSLSQLLTAEDVETRRVAAANLRQIRSRRGIAPLVRALEDPDLEVQYAAVIGLAEIIGDTSAAPSITLFKQEPGRYLDYWRARAKGGRM